MPWRPPEFPDPPDVDSCMGLFALGFDRMAYVTATHRIYLGMEGLFPPIDLMLQQNWSIENVNASIDWFVNRMWNPHGGNRSYSFAINSSSNHQDASVSAPGTSYIRAKWSKSGAAYDGACALSCRYVETGTGSVNESHIAQVRMYAHSPDGNYRQDIYVNMHSDQIFVTTGTSYTFNQSTWYRVVLDVYDDGTYKVFVNDVEVVGGAAVASTGGVVQVIPYCSAGKNAFAPAGTVKTDLWVDPVVYSNNAIMTLDDTDLFTYVLGSGTWNLNTDTGNAAPSPFTFTIDHPAPTINGYAASKITGDASCSLVQWLRYAEAIVYPHVYE